MKGGSPGDLQRLCNQHVTLDNGVRFGVIHSFSTDCSPGAFCRVRVNLRKWEVAVHHTGPGIRRKKL